MKYNLLLIIIIIYLNTSCTNTTEPVQQVLPTVIFYAELTNSYYDYNIGKSFRIKNVSGHGTIISQPLPTFESFSLNDKVFSGEDFYRFSIYRPGQLDFGDINNKKYPNLTSNLSTITFQLKTSFGELSGVVSLPDTITDMQINVNDTLAPNQQLIVTWEAGRADFYAISVYYTWKNDLNIRQSEQLHFFTEDTFYKFPISTFSIDGIIHQLYVIPMNGPMPKAGAKGNLSGDGSGYLYYQVKAFNCPKIPLIVGKGEGTAISSEKLIKPKIDQDGVEIEIIKLIKEKNILF